MTLHCQGLSKRYGSFTLEPLTVTFGSGVTCIVGANGAGKSTLFRLVAGIERPTAGHVRSGACGPSAIGYLPQEPAFPARATSDELLTYVSWLYRIPRRSRRDAVERALASVDLLDRRDEQLRRLSGGMRRRVAVATALVHDPQVLLLDEPTVGLDPQQRLHLRASIRAVAAQRVVLLSTHLVEDVRALAERVLVLREGSVVFDGTVPELSARADAESVGSALERAVADLIGPE